MDAALEPLLTALGEISDLGRARALLAWDERTQMPPRGAAIRAEQLATLTRLRHELLAGDELGRLIDAAESGLGSAAATTPSRRAWSGSHAASGRRRAACPPSCARRRPGSPRSPSTPGSAPARSRDFAAFLPHLERVIELRRRYVECFEADHPYDPLLDDFEPGMRTARAAPGARARCATGRWSCSPRSARAAVELDDSCLHGEFDLAGPGGAGARRSPRRCRSSPTPGASTRPCIRSRSGSGSPTCGSRPASTPPTSAPRSGR